MTNWKDKLRIILVLTVMALLWVYAITVIL